MIRKKSASPTVMERVRALAIGDSPETQHFGTTSRLPIALEASVCAASVDNLNQALADTKNDLLVSDVIRTNEMQVWFLAEHLVESPALR